MMSVCLFVCLSRKMITSSWESPVTTWTPHNHPVQLQVSFDGSKLVFHGSMSVFIGFQGFRLVSRWFHGFLRFLVGFHGFSRWFDGFSWFLVGLHGFSRWSHGFSWFLVGFHGFSRWFHGFWSLSMVNGPRLVKSELSAAGAKWDVKNTKKVFTSSVSWPHDPARPCRP